MGLGYDKLSQQKLIYQYINQLKVKKISAEDKEKITKLESILQQFIVSSIGVEGTSSQSPECPTLNIYAFLNFGSI